MYDNDPADHGDTNPYLDDRDAGFDLLGILVSHGVQTGQIDETDSDRLREFFAELQPQPLSRPYTPEEARRIADADGGITAIVGLGFYSLLGADEDSLGDQVSEAVTGSDVGLTDITVEPVGVNGGDVLLRVTGSIAEWLDEHLPAAEATGPAAEEQGDTCDRCGKGDRRVFVGYETVHGFDGLCDECLADLSGTAGGAQ